MSCTSVPETQKNQVVADDELIDSVVDVVGTDTSPIRVEVSVKNGYEVVAKGSICSGWGSAAASSRAVSLPGIFMVLGIQVGWQEEQTWRRFIVVPKTDSGHFRDNNG